jgi:phosphatidate cytidylyltransferase
LAKKQPPREFDPHPGDPWHPDWSLEGESASPDLPEGEEPWWRRALGRKAAAGESTELPEAYAALQEAEAALPLDVESELVTEAIAAAESALAEEALAPEVPPVVAEVEPVVAEVEPVVAEVEPAPTLEELAAQEAELETLAARRSGELADRLTVDARLELAESMAHEDARMWVAVGMARAEDDALSAAAERVAERAAQRDAERRAALDAWAAEALAIEEARLSMEESRRRTEAEVRTALDKGFGSGPAPATDPGPEAIDAADINARFAAIAAEIAASSAAEMDRRARREELRLRTSLLVLDAEQPWDVDGWSRPGASFNPRGAGRSGGGLARGNPVRSSPRGPSAQLMLQAQGSIATASPPAMPESADRRRWPWSRQSDSPTAPDGMQGSPRSVVAIEERSVSDRENEMGDEGQSELPLADASASVESPNGAALDDDLAAWSDLDWDVDIDASPSGEDPLHRGATILYGDPDSGDSPEEADWEAFTAEQYVQTATHEYADLAAAVAAAEAEAPEQAAIAADMPGLESNLVGLEDVVAAEGMDAATAAPARSDLAIRVVTALALVSLFFASLTFHWSIALLVLVVMALASFELTTTLITNDHHPVGLFAYLGTIGALLGTWAYGPVAVPVAAAATLVVTVLFFGLVTGRHEPLVGMALTVMVVLWVGVFASFAMDIINADEFRWLVGSFVVIVAAMDIAQYFVGKRFGKRKLAPVVSPKKTVAGLVGGVVTAMGVGYGMSFPAPFDAVTGVVLGGALALSGPIGDLAVSVLKRSLGVKDMGTILPGHGGVLDRIDAILFSLPAAWIVYSWAGLLV